jgi:DNA-binding MarR family transcriptional regulator
VPDEKDRRAFAVKLTPAGRRAFAEMAAVHERWIEEMLADLSPEDKASLSGLLSTLKRRLRLEDGR